MGTDDLVVALQKKRTILGGQLVASRQVFGARPFGVYQVIEDYLKVAQERAKKPMRPDTARRQGYILRKFVGDAGTEFVGQITHKSIEDWLRGFKDAKRSADTLHTYARALHTFVSYLVKLKLVRGDILTEFDIPERAAVGRKNWLRSQEMQRVIAESNDPSLTFILFCGFHAGLRRNEIANAKVGWFDLESGLIHIQNDVRSGFVLKDRENRSVPISEPFKAFLTKFIRDRKDDEYALRPEKQPGKWRYRYDFDSLVTSHFRRCGVKCTIHDTRRSFASNLVSAGESIYIVAKWLGDGGGRCREILRSSGALRRQHQSFDSKGCLATMALGVLCILGKEPEWALIAPVVFFLANRHRRYQQGGVAD